MTDKISAGALRAAKTIAWDYYTSATYASDFDSYDDRHPSNLARIIDRETGLGELIEAAENLMAAVSQVSPEVEVPLSIGITILEIRKALARGQGKD